MLKAYLEGEKYLYHTDVTKLNEFLLTPPLNEEKYKIQVDIIKELISTIHKQDKE